MIIDAHTRYAGFWRRLAATMIDTLLLLAVSVPFMLLFGHGMMQTGLRPGAMPALPGAREFLLNYVLPLVLTVFFWVKYLGTPGKLLLGCRVVDAASGAPLSTRQATLRYFAYLVSILPLCLGFLWIAWDKRKQGFHDKIAKSVVVLEDPAHMSLEELQKELR